uniref:Uncharacterized protein n=1 Tax=Oryza brachyantha TaxID=4533 RepID=J3M4Q1_ORYBR
MASSSSLPSTPTLSRTSASPTRHPKVPRAMVMHARVHELARSLDRIDEHGCMCACSESERAAVQGPGGGGGGRLLLLRRRRRGEPAVRVHGAVRADPGAEHAGRVTRPRRRGPRRRVPAALPPEGVGDGGGAGGRRLLRLRLLVPGQQGLRQGAPARRRLRRAAGARPLPLQQRQRAGCAVRVAEQPEPRARARRRRALRLAAPRRPPRQDAPHRRGHRRQDQSQLPPDLMNTTYIKFGLILFF